MGEITEYCLFVKGGDKQVLVDSPEVEKIYPLADRIKDYRAHGGRVFRRRIVVIEDWTEVPK